MFRLYTHDIRARRFLFYAATLLPPDASAIELAPVDAFLSDLVASSAEETMESVHIPILGKGTHRITFEDTPLIVTVDHLIDQRALYLQHGQLIKHVTVAYDVLTPAATAPPPPFKDIRDLVFAMIDRARPALTAYIDQRCQTSIDTLNKFIFSAEHGFWQVLATLPKRSLDSVFLPEDHRRTLSDFVTHFFDPTTVADYARFFIPHKANVLLYGRAGMGKTSTTHALASHIHSHIGLIPVSPKLTDDQLVFALQKTKRHGIRIVVLEDIDTLFVNRKDHDTARNALTLSGLLNCLDGLFRGSGLMVFLTTNHIDRLDEALLRTSRIDIRVEYTAATEDQVRQCFRYYFPGQSPADAETLWRALEHTPFSMSTLQEQFFRYRKTPRLLDHLDDIRTAVREAAAAPGNKDAASELVYI